MASVISKKVYGYSKLIHELCIKRLLNVRHIDRHKYEIIPLSRGIHFFLIYFFSNAALMKTQPHTNSNLSSTIGPFADLINAQPCPVSVTYSS